MCYFRGCSMRGIGSELNVMMIEDGPLSDFQVEGMLLMRVHCSWDASAAGASLSLSLRQLAACVTGCVCMHVQL